MSGDAGVVEGPLHGYHHETYVVPLPGRPGEAEPVRWKCREPRPGLLWFDRRCFASEEQLLRALEGRIEGIPDLIQAGTVGLQRFIEGKTLGAMYGSGAEVPPHLCAQIIGLFEQLARVRPGSFATERAFNSTDRAAGDDTAVFLEKLIAFTERMVYLRNQPAFGGLFRDLGLGDISFRTLREHVSGLTRRPFCLLHADLHRENFVVDAEMRLWTIDWELAMFGDPLYDLATHLYLMRYPAEQETRMAERWCETVEDVAPGSSAGWERDLPKLLDYKRAQSVFTDVIRAALQLDARSDPEPFTHAGRKISEVLQSARVPLALPSVPDAGQAAAALYRWNAKSMNQVSVGRRETGLPG
ncbi:aminoglycoside phosphotransferase family protein [Streptomyces sp. NBC_00386]|uniref:aminoglycoside phosphotransferase family protein n=1 Tax=Streptomyces sp. NBC_00386 TaxID=2975734 RepID=UPI002E227E42